MTDLKHEMLTQLLDASRQLAENRLLEPLLNYAMDKALDLVGGEQGYLILLSNKNTLDFKIKRSKKGQDLENPEEQISQTILSKVILIGEDLIIKNAIDDPQYSQSESVRALRLRSVMCVPMTSRGKTIGALYVENRTAQGIFKPEDIVPLKYFASQAAVAIENAILNDELENRVAVRTAELESAMRQLEQSWMEAVEFNRLRSEFLSKVAHDIRSPLGTVITALSLFEDGSFGEVNIQQQEWLAKSLRTLKHVARLTEDFFDLTKLQMGKLALYPEVIQLGDYLRDIYQVSKALPWSSEVVFEIDIASDLPAITLDPTRIQQVILNLLSNAMKFTQQGQVTLFGYMLKNDNGVVIGVQDTGTGIPEDQVHNLFERFQQAGPSEMRKQGSGLGLAICRELVELHGGHIEVTSKIGEGSTFQFMLPL